jgi:hypothetical protein
LALVILTGAAAAFGQDVIKISTLIELQNIESSAAARAGNYELANDINASSSKTMNSGAGFKPIGENRTYPFSGKLDGKGYVIRGLYINRLSTSRVGLFGFIGDNAVVENLGIEVDTIIGMDSVGGVAGCNNGTIRNCYVKGFVRGRNYVGGIAGFIDSEMYRRGIVTRSYSSARVGGTNTSVGGIAGYMNRGEVSNSYATGYVYANNDYPGGLVGYTKSGNIIINCYSTGRANGVGGYRGLVGTNYQTGAAIVASYWDVNTSSATGSAGGAGKTTEEMKQQATFEEWDFEEVWQINEGVGYPTLRGIDGQVSVRPRAVLTRAGLSVPQLMLRGKTLTVSSDAPSAYEIRLVDLRGKTVSRFRAESGGSFSLANLPSGRYFAEVRESGKRTTSAFVLR